MDFAFLAAVDREVRSSMDRNSISGRIRWTIGDENPVIAPGQLHADMDSRRAGAAHVLQLGDRYRMYYWGTGTNGFHRILIAESPVDEPNDWQPVGVALSRQRDTDYNDQGPGFPFVVPSDDGPWLLYFCGWGKTREDGKLPNTTGVAVSDDGGYRFSYPKREPVLPLDRDWDREGTGSVCVLRVNARYHMYYTSIGAYFNRPEGAITGHGDVIPRIGVAYAGSRDGMVWTKPTDGLMVGPRGFATEPYEYICSKPFVMREPGGYRMWVNTFGTAYRIRSLVGPDGRDWRWCDSGPDGELGVGNPGAFDDRQRCYVSVVRCGDEYRCWYTGNGFGATGMGYAVGVVEDER